MTVGPTILTAAILGDLLDPAGSGLSAFDGTTVYGIVVKSAGLETADSAAGRTVVSDISGHETAAAGYTRLTGTLAVSRSDGIGAWIIDVTWDASTDLSAESDAAAIWLALGTSGSSKLVGYNEDDTGREQPDYEPTWDDGYFQIPIESITSLTVAGVEFVGGDIPAGTLADRLGLERGDSRTLAALGDVDLATDPPGQGDHLIYDSVLEKWVPGETGSHVAVFEGQWNPTFAAGSEPVVHIGATIASIVPAIASPVRNITSLCHPAAPLGADPTFEDVPQTGWVEVDDNPTAARIGTTVVIAGAPFVFGDWVDGDPVWTRNVMIDATGNTVTAFGYYPTLPSDDTLDLTAFLLIHETVHEFTIPGTAVSGEPGDIATYTLPHLELAPRERASDSRYDPTDSGLAATDVQGAIDEVAASVSGGSGDVVGPGSSTAHHFAKFADTSGALLEDGGAVGGAASLNVGTSAGTVAAGDDSRIVNAVQTSRTLAGLDLSSDRSASTLRTALSLVVGTDVQAYAADLAAVAALTPTNDDLLQRKSGAWTNRTPAQVKTDLALVKGDVGLGSVTNDAQVKAAWSPTRLYTASDQSWTTDTTLANVTGLTQAIGASETWFIDVLLNVSGGSTGDVKVTVTAPTSATAELQVIGPATGGTTGVTNAGTINTPGTDVIASGLQTGSSNRNQVRIQGVVFNSTNAGSITVQAAQNTSDGTATVVRKGSTMKAERLA